ncbi:RNA-binding domain-containing protein [Allomuricauda taeanensis]|uniref:RNA-binding domain-containing protein n=1 Tax=Flagellimonas taeanensis TaxID=1005926 RepID=UPI002E7B6682|nr:RNA-binding domain-containing protein [Allomuricauda taeanensis]MEE1961998.1 RNA-binding domain-containing protein [Allomuricauda taeanensis]
MKCTFELNSKGYIKQRESFDLEFKQSFHYGDSLALYCRSLVGMANNKGGELIFGIKDSPREPIGLKNDRFENCDPNRINQFLIAFFSHEIHWSIETLEYHGNSFGRISVEESSIKPVVCTAVYKNILREAAIYYRYRGETKEICYPELAAILQAEREKEKLLWLKHVEKIGEVGPQNIHLIDTFNGEISTGKGKILIDKSIVKALKFIKEGEFTEKKGAPTLKLIGEISGEVDTTNIPKTDFLYPYRFANFNEEMGINNFQFQAILWKLDVKGNAKYHTEISVGKSSLTHKYSQAFMDRLKSIMGRYPEWLNKTVEDFKKHRK